MWLTEVILLQIHTNKILNTDIIEKCVKYSFFSSIIHFSNNYEIMSEVVMIQNAVHLVQTSM